MLHRFALRNDKATPVVARRHEAPTRQSVTPKLMTLPSGGSWLPIGQTDEGVTSMIAKLPFNLRIVLQIRSITLLDIIVNRNMPGFPHGECRLMILA